MSKQKFLSTNRERFASQGKQQLASQELKPEKRPLDKQRELLIPLEALGRKQWAGKPIRSEGKSSYPSPHAAKEIPKGPSSSSSTSRNPSSCATPRRVSTPAASPANAPTPTACSLKKYPPFHPDPPGDFLHREENQRQPHPHPPSRFQQGRLALQDQLPPAGQRENRSETAGAGRPLLQGESQEDHGEETNRLREGGK